ncbi:hypothetical protein HpCHN32_11860 [Helicobacter pylori]
MQMLFDKINNGSPFGVIREVFSFSPQLRQFLNNKCLESLFFVYENEPSTTFEVPRVKLENIKLPDMKEIYVNQWYINIFINTFIFSINEGFYILTGV